MCTPLGVTAGRAVLEIVYREAGVSPRAFAGQGALAVREMWNTRTEPALEDHPSGPIFVTRAALWEEFRRPKPSLGA